MLGEAALPVDGAISEPRHVCLDPEDVVNIHRLLGLGASVKGIAQKYGMRVRQIERIRDGKAWKSLWPGASAVNARQGAGDPSGEGETARPVQFTGGEA